MTSTTSNTKPQGHIVKFQELLRDLFQFDKADLDFGIYRIMNHKRDQILRFINDNLPATIDEALNSEYLSEQARAVVAFEKVKHQVIKALGDDALDTSGKLVAHLHSTPIGKQYLARQRDVEEIGARSRDETEARIYNHLYTFFSRYYQDGDFVSKRRYSRNQRYVVPYNGEEVLLHWANSDQYYVKTDEYFRNYTWKGSNGVTIRFQMYNADIEHNNVKGTQRFVVPIMDKVKYIPETVTVIIPFEYRPLKVAEGLIYGKHKQQEVIVNKATDNILHSMNKEPDVFLAFNNQHHLSSQGEPVSYLEHHLRKYISRNKADFFIHKNLSDFLNRELDFYLKNEILNLDSLATAGFYVAQAEFQLIRLIKTIGIQIIEFLSQIEGFQKMLWEKRKFVTKTDYCVALRCVDEKLYPVVISNDKQWEEWCDLCGIDRDTDRNEIFLSKSPTLMLDTRHFDESFVDQLLASFENLEIATDGLMIHGDNWQAMQLLGRKYSGQIDCIYIDPPYNTGQDDFLYKDHYQHSTWLTMMDGLMPLWKQMLANTGSLVSHIDEHEVNRLDELISMRFGIHQNVGPMIWDKRNPKGDATAIATQHEYLCWAVKSYSDLKSRGGLFRTKENAQVIIDKAKELLQKNGGVSDGVRDQFKSWMKRQDFSGGEKAYVHLDEDGHVYQSVSMAWPNKQQAPDQYFKPLIHPVTKRACPVPARGWRNPPKTMSILLEQGKILFGPDETTQPRRKYLLQDHMSENVPSLYYFGGSDDSLQRELGYFFPNPKPVRIGEYIISIAAPDSQGIVLDCFAGSGTTGHAVVNLNRGDEGQRKFILIEIGQYFDSEMLPRIKKVAYSQEWKAGKPFHLATQVEIECSPRVIKYIKLESYEDSLDSIVFVEQQGQQSLEEKFGDEYLIKYMLNWETKGSATLVNAGQMTRPFSYQLDVHVNGERSTKTVDLPETFNWLLGLNICTRQVFHDEDRRYLVYRGEPSDRPGHRIAVVWRESQGWDRDDYDRDRQFIEENGISRKVDILYVNGGSCIPGAISIEPIFKERMFATVDDSPSRRWF